MIITLMNGEQHEVRIVKEPVVLEFPSRFEVQVVSESGIQTGETAIDGYDNPTLAWCFPAETEREAIRKFIAGIEELRRKNQFYGLELIE